jgi:hypothetical protein
MLGPNRAQKTRENTSPEIAKILGFFDFLAPSDHGSFDFHRPPFMLFPIFWPPEILVIFDFHRPPVSPTTQLIFRVESAPRFLYFYEPILTPHRPDNQHSVRGPENDRPPTLRWRPLVFLQREM